MSVKVDIYEAATTLVSLVDRAAAGEEIVILKSGRLVARLVPLADASKAPRVPANALGITFLADDFDSPLPLSLA